jgi:SAM-dependent methyltransferase
MAEQLRIMMERVGIAGKTLLDVACGEGTFAVAAAKKGFAVTGVDLSQNMLELAREKAARDGVAVEFKLADMRTMALNGSFDLATCWYDSLNYLLELDELQRTFVAVATALRENGCFLFDMNTVYGLTVNWQRQRCYVQQDKAEIFEVHRTSFDFETMIATLRITGFLRQKGRWVRVDEVHRERGYSLEDIAACAVHAGFREIARWGNIRDMTEPTPESGRIWFAMRKDGSMLPTSSR